jgi:hypothetical protein
MNRHQVDDKKPGITQNQVFVLSRAHLTRMRAFNLSTTRLAGMPATRLPQRHSPPQISRDDYKLCRVRRRRLQIG